MSHFIIQSGLGICTLTYNQTLEWYLDVLHQGVTLVLVVLAAPLTAWQGEATQLLRQCFHLPETGSTQSPSNRLHPGSGSPPHNVGVTVISWL